MSRKLLTNELLDGWVHHATNKQSPSKQWIYIQLQNVDVYVGDGCRVVAIQYYKKGEKTDAKIIRQNVTRYVKAEGFVEDIKIFVGLKVADPAHLKSQD